MQRTRLIYLDAFRGFIIFLMMWIHPLVGIIFSSDPGAIDEIRPWVLICLAPLAILTSWAPVFVLTSGTANAYVMYTALKNHAAQPNMPSPLKKMLLRGLLNGGMLCLFSVVNMAFLHHATHFNGTFQHTLLTGWLMTGAVQPFSVQLLFFNDALAMIGITGILTTLLLCLLWRGKGFEKQRRNYGIVASVALLWILASPLLHLCFDGAFFRCLDEERWFAALALKCFIGPRFSPFPMAAYGFFGVLFGLALGEGLELRWFRRFGYGAGGAFLALFAGTVAIQGFRYVEFTWHTVPMKIHLLDMGLILLVATLLLEISRFRSAACHERFARWTVTLRRLGRVSLSIFLAETLVSVLMAKLYLALLGTAVFPRQPLAIVPFLTVTILFWVGVSRVWERHGFKYGLEWLLVLLNRKLVGHRSLRLEATHATGENA